eukprot:TRINITY_DN8786_c0_g1_i5.p1 TRINITY_DN8786_c0_g1~~TRINITY_DN8786_c0_g1_i5.p1  ORF type:complete len:702 (-),score=208.74 TRINITY_DN8786_c0_g1_i5:139-2244(-)
MILPITEKTKDEMDELLRKKEVGDKRRQEREEKKTEKLKQKREKVEREIKRQQIEQIIFASALDYKKTDWSIKDGIEYKNASKLVKSCPGGPKLIVHVFKARGLKFSDPSKHHSIEKELHPFVLAKLTKEQKCRTPKADSSDPKWNTEVVLSLVGVDENSVVVLEVFETEGILKGKESLGRLEFPIFEALLKGSEPTWYTLSFAEVKDTGDILVNGTTTDGSSGSGSNEWVPGDLCLGFTLLAAIGRPTILTSKAQKYLDGPKLRVSLNNATKLMPVNAGQKKCNPYPCISFSGQKVKVPKIKETNDPVWNLDVMFSLVDADLPKQEFITITCRDFQPSSTAIVNTAATLIGIQQKDPKIGKVKLSLDSALKYEGPRRYLLSVEGEKRERKEKAEKSERKEIVETAMEEDTRLKKEEKEDGEKEKESDAETRETEMLGGKEDKEKDEKSGEDKDDNLIGDERIKFETDLPKIRSDPSKAPTIHHRKTQPQIELIFELILAKEGFTINSDIPTLEDRARIRTKSVKKNRNLSADEGRERQVKKEKSRKADEGNQTEERVRSRSKSSEMTENTASVDSETLKVSPGSDHLTAVEMTTVLDTSVTPGTETSVKSEEEIRRPRRDLKHNKSVKNNNKIEVESNTEVELSQTRQEVVDISSSERRRRKITEGESLKSKVKKDDKDNIKSRKTDGKIERRESRKKGK